ncbi:hypothetical protein [Aquabacterium sp. J223]|uniref:hypothetical protein n=1 Tax=Aquabacterium sp. J223 TaxID=2898431 RepID=UPI0021ADFAA2|nr:hypothetical protein [Aquabacterium sp. J223]UUX94806.1 hypothetical protein LRS07_16190 [Aquabacterium sp. J223]
MLRSLSSSARPPAETSKTLTARAARLSALIVPACLGLLLAIGVLADARLARGLSLQWAAPWLRGEAPPLIAVAAAFVLASVLVALTLLRRWLPSAEHAPIVLLFLATQFVGFNLANIEPLKIALLITSGMWLADSLTNDRPVRLYPPFLMMWLAILAFAFASVLNGLVISFVAQYSIIAKFLMFFIVANLVRTPSQLVFTVRLLVALGIASAVLALAQEAVFYFWKIPLSLDDNAPKYWFKETPWAG